MTESTVNVAVRIRPLVPYELKNGSKSCVSVVPNKQKIQIRDAEQVYRFDHVFGPEIDNYQFYNSAIRNQVAEVFNERDVTILAYGRRSSGKTYTMGTNYTGEENMGIIPLALNTVFDIIDSHSDEIYKVAVTFVELYNKELYDLLAPNKVGDERIVKTSSGRSNGLTEKQVTNSKDALQYLKQGSQKRATSKKTYNSQSTRSHAVFTISIKQRKNVDPRIATTSKLHFVDLAGSKTGKNAGKKFKGNINKDFLAVGNLINQLRKGKSESCAKYRENKLVILLRDSLLGNSITLIIACVGPADCSLTETLDTLQYANRLRKMKRETIEGMNEVFRRPDRKSIAVRPNLENWLQQSISVTQDIQETFQGETNVDVNVERIQKGLESRKSREVEQESFQSETDGDTDAERIQEALESSKSSTAEQESFHSDADEDTDAERIRKALESRKSSEDEQESFQSETDGDTDVEMIQEALESSKSSTAEQETFQSDTDEDTDAERIQDPLESSKSNKVQQKEVVGKMYEDMEAKRIQNASGSNKSGKSEVKKFQSESDEDTDAERIHGALQSSKSDKTVQEEIQSTTNINTGAERIQDALRSHKSGKSELEEVPSGTDNDTNAKRIQEVLESSKSSKNELEEVQSETDEDMETERIQDGLGSHKSSKPELEEAQSETDDNTDVKRIQEALESSKSSEDELEEVQTDMDEDMETKRIRDALGSHKSSKSELEEVPSETDNDTNVEGIQEALKSSKSSKDELEEIQSDTDEDMETERIQDALGSHKSSKPQLEEAQSETDDNTDVKRIQEALESSKSSKDELEEIQSDTDEDMETERIQDALRSHKSSKSELEDIRSEINKDTEAERIQNALESNKSSKSEHQAIQNESDEDTKAERIQNAPESNKSNEPEQEEVQSESDEDTKAEWIQNALESNKSNKSEQEEVQSEMDEDTNAERIQKAPESNKSNESDQEEVQSETDDVPDADKIQSSSESWKSSKVDQETVQSKKSEDTPSKFFMKIADLILEPSGTEQEELQKEIRDLRRKLRDRTDKLNASFMETVNMRMDLSEKTRGNMKTVLAKILEEFHEVLLNLAENSEIQNWILRVYRRIDELLYEQKKAAWKMLKCEMAKDEAMDEQYAEHTMHQMERYHELQGVNRCIAMLGELIVSLLKAPESLSVRELVKNLEDTKRKIEALETEKFDLVLVLKDAEWNNESRRLSEFGIGKSLQLDEKISKLWRRRIRQMMAIEKKEKFDQQIAGMTAQIDKLKSEKVRLEGEMLHAEKQWKRTIAAAEQKSRRKKTMTKKAKKNSKVSIRCACKTNCLSRRCSCVKNGLPCTNCNCNEELCQNSDKGNDLKEPSFIESQASKRSTDGTMEIDSTTGSSSIDSCTCRKNGETCTNCNRGTKLHNIKEKRKARRRLFTDIVLPHENTGDEHTRKRPRLEV